MGEVLSLFQQCLHQGTANTGVAVSIYPVGEPRAGNADLGCIAALHHPVVSLTPFLHCQHRFLVRTPVLLLVSRRRQQEVWRTDWRTSAVSAVAGCSCGFCFGLYDQLHE